MTREEFLSESRHWDWYNLRDFCNDEQCYLCERVFDSAERDEVIEERASEMACSEGWRELCQYLHNLSDSSDFYDEGDYGEWQELDDADLHERILDVLEWMDNNEFWDDDEADDEVPDEDEEEDAEPIEVEEIPFPELFSSCHKGFKKIEEECEKDEKAFRESLGEFISGAAFKVTL